MFRNVHILRLDRGKQVIAELSDYCHRKNISSAIIYTVIGSLQKVKFPRLSLDTSKFTEAYDELVGPFAVVGQGSISMFKDERVIHIHLVLAKYETAEAIGGHLAEGEVLNTLEIYIGELSHEIKREIDPKLGHSEVVTM